MRTSDFRSSLWTATAIPAPETPTLAGERQTDVCVVGGGFTGLSTALHLAEAGADVVLLEAQHPGFGASGRNNGQVIPAYSRHLPDDVVRELGPERGERLNAWVAGSADLVFALIERHGIACDAARNGWLQPAHRPGRIAAVRAKHDQWAARGAPVEMLNAARAAELTGSPYYHGGWMHRGGGHIQPLSYARGLAAAALKAGAALHAASPATGLKRSGGGWRVETPRGTVEAEQVVLATNAYSDALWPGLARSIVPLRTFHAATRPLSDNVAKSILPFNQGISDTRQLLWAFRKDRFGRLVTSGTPLFTVGASGAMAREVLRRLRVAFPQIEGAVLEPVWEGKVAMTLDRLPRFHELAPGAYAGLGYSGRGIAMATAMGRQLAARCQGTPAGELAVPASPVRPLPAHALITPLARAMTLIYRWRDERG